MTELDIKTNRIKDLKNFINSLSILDNIVTFDIKNTGIYVKSMDPSGISLVETELPKSLFSKWNIKEGGTINIDKDKVKDILKSAKKDSELKIKTITGDKPTLKFIINNIESEIPFEEVSNKRNIPDIKDEYTAQIEIPVKPLKEFLNNNKKLNRDLLLILNKNSTATLFLKGDTEKQKIIIPIKGKPSEMVTNFINVEYLLKMLKAANKDSNIELAMKSEKPIKISYPSNDTIIKYWLAPYLEDDKEIIIKEALGKPIKEKQKSNKHKRLKA